MWHIKLIAWREYLKIIRKKSFWATTLLLPILFLVVSVVSGLTSNQLEDSIAEQAEQADRIILVDQSGLIRQDFIQEPIEKSDDREASIETVRAGEADALIIYPEDIRQSQTIQVYANDTGVVSRGQYNQLATSLLEQSLLSRIGNQELVQLIQAEPQVEVTTYLDGEPAAPISSFILPGLLAIAYFFLVAMSTNYLVMGVTEEKENRVMEIMLTTTTPTRLILGKITGLIGVAFSQLAITIGLLIGIALTASTRLPLDIDLSNLEIDPVQLAVGIVFLVLGYVVLALIVTGIGSIMTTAQEAGSLTGIFIMLSISPIYFFSIVLAEPEGWVSTLTSYLPFTSPIVLLLRNALGVLSPLEIALSIAALLGYVALGAWLVSWLFHKGALSYNQKLSLKEVIGRT